MEPLEKPERNNLKPEHATSKPKPKTVKPKRIIIAKYPFLKLLGVQAAAALCIFFVLAIWGQIRTAPAKRGYDTVIKAFNTTSRKRIRMTR